MYQQMVIDIELAIQSLPIVLKFFSQTHITTDISTILRNSVANNHRPENLKTISKYSN